MIEIPLQVVDPSIFKEASPYGTAVYGLLVVALVAALIYLDRKLTNKDKDYRDLAEKTMIVITEVKEKILDIRDHRITVINKLDDLYKEITKLKKDHE